MKAIDFFLLIGTLFIFSCKGPGPEENNQPGGPLAKHTTSESPFGDLPRLSLPLSIEGGIDARPAFPLREVDSLFIARYINPGYYQAEEPQYQYAAGAVVLEKEGFIAVVYPFEHTFGTDYLLITYRPDGQMLDSLLLAETAGDYYFQSATVEANGTINIERHYLDGTTPPRRSSASITPSGKIEKRPSKENNRKLGWEGNYHLRQAIPQTRGGLNIKMAGPEALQFNIWLAWGEDFNVREVSGRARITGQKAIFQEDGCRIEMVLEADRILITQSGQGDCGHASGVDFGGSYLSSSVFPYKELVEDEENSFASCFAYKVVDEDGTPIPLPPSARQLLECPLSLAMAPDWSYFLVADGNVLKSYQFDRQEIKTILTLPAQIEGCSPMLWAPDGQSLALASVNQGEYPRKTRMHLLAVKDGPVWSVKAFDVAVNFHCGNMCSVTPYEDFWFESDGHLAYRTYKAFPGDLEGESAVKRLP